MFRSTKGLDFNSSWFAFTYKGRTDNTYELKIKFRILNPNQKILELVLKRKESN